jgi:hypothetical protein
MERRQFLAASIAASALAAANSAFPQDQGASQPEFYQFRRYTLVSGNEQKLTENYFATALIPAVTRWGMGPVGAFKVEYGPETPAYYLLIPGSSVEGLAELDQRFSKDTDFLHAADPYWNATAGAPAFQRIDISLLKAFDGWPKLVRPASSANKEKRIFQLRTYESPSNGEHVRKVEMFHAGEFEIFKKTGCSPVFFSDALTGSRLPCLTYMLSFRDVAALEAGWAAFLSDPDWKKLVANPRYAFDPIVTNITNLVLTPLGCSQI